MSDKKTGDENCENFIKNYNFALKLVKFFVDLSILVFILLIYIFRNKYNFDDQSIIEISNYFYCYPFEVYVVSHPYEQEIGVYNPLMLSKMTSYDINDSNEADLTDIEEYNDPYDNYYECDGDFDENNTTFCKDIYSSFSAHMGEKISNIFDLNSYNIKKYCLITFIFYVLYLIFIYPPIINEKFECFNKKEKFCSIGKKKIHKILKVMKILAAMFWLIKSVLYYVLWTLIEKGDLQKYEDFLKCKYVKKNYFDDNFPSIHKFRIFYIILLILNLTTELIDKVETSFNSILEENEKTDNSTSNEGQNNVTNCISITDNKKEN